MLFLFSLSHLLIWKLDWVHMLNSFGKLTPEVKQGKEKYYDSRIWSMNGSKLHTEIKDIRDKPRFSNKFWI